MWLFHPKGFVSIVADSTDTNRLLVRGRVKGDIEALFPAAKVTVTPDRDYRFRASIERWEVAARAAELIGDISYPNFKDAAPANRHRTYMDVWTAMWKLQFNRIPLRGKKRTAKRVNPLDWQSFYSKGTPYEII